MHSGITYRVAAVCLLVLAAVCLCGSGSLFAQTLATLYLFGPGGSPEGKLVEGTDWNLYGTTYGYLGKGNGMIFKITPTGTLTTLHSFDKTDGANPTAFVQHSNGIFYGTTVSGGKTSYHFCQAYCGALFSLSVP